MGHSHLHNMVFQLDHLGLILPEWENLVATPHQTAPNLAWTSTGDTRLMLRVLRVLGHRCVLPEQRLYTTAFQRRFGLWLPKLFEILEEVPTLPDSREIRTRWIAWGSQFR